MTTNPPTTEPEEVFKEGELNMTRVNPDWTLDQLLEQPGLFFYKDIYALMNLSKLRPRYITRLLGEQSHDPWAICGLRKLWAHWVVKMSLFAPYYRTQLNPWLAKPVDPSWDANALLIQKGVYLLAHVCEKIPFTSHQLRYKAKCNPKARVEYGIWKEGDVFLVQMETFGPWITRLWKQLGETTPAPKKKVTTKAGRKHTVKR